MTPLELLAQPISTKLPSIDAIKQPVAANLVPQKKGGIIDSVLGFFEGIGKKAGELGASTIQGIARTGVSTGITIGNAINTARGKDIVTSYTAPNKAAEVLLGKEPVRDLATQAAEAEPSIQNFSKSNLSKELFGTAGSSLINKLKTPLAVGAVTGGAFLDLFPGSAPEKNLLSTLAKESKDVVVRQILERSVKNLTPEAIDRVVPAIAKSSSAKEIEVILKDAVNESTATRPRVNPQAPFIEVPKTPPSDFNAKQYVAEQTKLRESARAVDEGGLVEKGKDLLKTAKRKLVDFAAPIEDVLASTLKKNKLSLLPEHDITNQIDRVLRAPTLAGQFVKDNGLEAVIKKTDNLNNLEQYLIAKHSIDLDTRGIATGRDIAKDTALVKALSPRYEPEAAVVRQYSRELLDYVQEAGLVSKELATELKTRYPNYVPFERVFNALEEGAGRGGRSIANLSNQTVLRRIEGSNRQVESPLQSLLSRTNEAFKQAERNRAAQTLASYEKLPGNPFQLRPIRTTEDVTRKIELFSEAKDLKPIQRKAETLARNKAHELKVLQREIENLNKKGLKESLRPKKGEILKNPVKTSIKSKFTFSGENRQILKGVPALQAEESVVTGKLGHQDAKKFIEQIIQDKNIDLEAIKRKLANREPKVAATIDELEGLRDEFEGIKELRTSLRDEALSLKQGQAAPDKATISFFDNGVKNIYETTKDVAEAAQALNVQQMNIFGKIMSYPVRAARVGITGMNPAFIAANAVKDQLTAFVNGNFGLRGSMANPNNFLKSLMTVLKHDDLYEEVVRAGGGGTSFDMSRRAVEQTLGRIRAGQDLKSKIIYTVKHPSELIRAVEDIVSRGEELTRVQQYRATKEGLLAKGFDEKNARIGAARAARENTVNFARRGEWGTVLNSAFLYLNAGIQGSRTLLRNLSTKPAATATKIALGALFPVATVTAWNLSDPKRKRAYNSINEYEKEGNIIIVPPNPTKDKQGRWNVIKIPLAQGISNLTGLVRRPLEAMSGLKPLEFNDASRALIGAVSPVDPSLTGVVSAALPQAVKPVAQGFSNFDFFTGNNTVPSYLQKLPPKQQVYNNTSGTARQIAGLLNVSPIKAEKFIKDTFGGLGTQATNFVDYIQSEIGTIPKKQIGGQSSLDAIYARFSKATVDKNAPSIKNDGL